MKKDKTIAKKAAPLPIMLYKPVKSEINGSWYQGAREIVEVIEEMAEAINFLLDSHRESK